MLHHWPTIACFFMGLERVSETLRSIPGAPDTLRFEVIKVSCIVCWYLTSNLLLTLQSLTWICWSHWTDCISSRTEALSESSLDILVPDTVPGTCSSPGILFFIIIIWGNEWFPAGDLPHNIRCLSQVFPPQGKGISSSCLPMLTNFHFSSWLP